MRNRYFDKPLSQGLRLIKGGAILTIVALVALWLSGTPALLTTIAMGTWIIVGLAAISALFGFYMMLGGALLIIRTER